MKIKIGEERISPSLSARNLGAFWDTNMLMNVHVSNLCKALCYTLYSIGKIRKYMTREATLKILHGLYFSRLDYVNSLLIGLPKNLIYRLQLTMNIAARIIFKAKPQDHVTPLLQELQWLSVSQRIDHKVLTLTFKTLHGLAPSYLSELLTTYQPTRSLRSEDKDLLSVPYSRTKTYGDRSFSVMAPRLWNRIPGVCKQSQTVRAFRLCTKAYLLSEKTVH
jgi:hypothetical protein